MLTFNGNLKVYVYMAELISYGFTNLISGDFSGFTTL